MARHPPLRPTHVARGGVLPSFTDNGETFDAEIRLTEDPPDSPANSWAPSLAARGSKVWISWFDFRDGNFETYTKRSSDTGVSGSVGG